MRLTHHGGRGKERHCDVAVVIDRRGQLECGQCCKDESENIGTSRADGIFYV